MNRLNNFDAFRLLGALLVIVGHGFHLLGRPEEVPVAFGFPIHTLGVVIFFSISGYLISSSWARSRALGTYFAARCLRIFPGLIAVVLVSMLVIGPLMTVHSMSDYFSAPAFGRYARNILMEPAYDLPGVFSTTPYPNAVNGSLWTLPAEFFCYVVVPIVCVRKFALRVPMLSLLMFASLVLARIPADDSAIIYGTRITDAAGMWVFFIAGALLHALQERWNGLFRTDVAVLAVLGQATLVALRPAWVADLSWVFLPYAILTAGLASTPYLRRAARHGDLSYGLYLWAFPVQQVLIETLGPQRMAINLPLVTGITLVLAWISWHVIEGPSMQLKKRISRGRRTAPTTAVISSS